MAIQRLFDFCWMEQYPAAVRKTNSDGALPLHLFCGADDLPLDAFKYLVRSFPVRQKTNAGAHALHAGMPSVVVPRCFAGAVDGVSQSSP